MRAEILSQLNQERAARRACVLVTNLASGEARLVKALDVVKEPLAGTTLGEAVAEGIRTGKSGMAEIDGMKFFLTVQTPPMRIVVIGAVHVSQALAPMAKQLGFEVTIIDPRTAFATPERFLDVTLLAEWPDAALPRLNVDRYTAFAALTHDPKIDDPGLEHALARECMYIGALGSRRTHAKRVERLQAKGFTEAAIARIRAPIGLDISAISPAEIALSILAEIVSSLRKKERRA